MIARSLLWLTSVVLILCALLAVWRVPSIAGWKLALLATEFGHWVVVAPFLVAVAASAFSVGSDRICLLILNTGTSALLLSPAIRGQRVAGEAEATWKQSAFAAVPSPGGVTGFRWRELWTGTTPRVSPPETQVFFRGDGFELKLDFFRPMAGSVPAPCVLVIHGGGWDGGERSQLPELNAELVARGYAVATIDYRLAPRWRWPAPREDVLAAMRWLRAHAGDLGIAGESLVLLGRSAGAQIALATAYHLGRAEVRGVVSLYGPADLRFAYEYGTENDTLRSLSLLRRYLGGAPEGAGAAYDDASPYRFVRAEVPPTLLLHGAGDTLVWHRQSERLAEKLAAAGVPHRFISLPWATHAFDFNPHGPGGQIARSEILRFLAAVAPPRESKTAAVGTAAAGVD